MGVGANQKMESPLHQRLAPCVAMLRQRGVGKHVVEEDGPWHRPRPRCGAPCLIRGREGHGHVKGHEIRVWWSVTGVWKRRGGGDGAHSRAHRQPLIQREKKHGLKMLDLKSKLNVGDKEVHRKGPSIVVWHVLNQKLQCLAFFSFFTLALLKEIRKQKVK